MMKLYLKASVLIGVSFFVFLTATVHAGNQLRVTPVRVEFSQAEKIFVLVVKNEGEVPALIQTALFKWQQNSAVQKGQEQLEDELVPTKDILVSPPIFKLAPLVSQNIRLGYRGVVQASEASALPVQELAYRIKVSEVPTKETQQTPQGLNVLVSFSVPIFIKPAGYVANFSPVWQVSKTNVAKKSAYKITLSNQGNTHEQIKSIKLYEGETLIAEANQIGYVLPGKSRVWQLNAVKNASGKLLKLLADSDRGLIEQNVTTE